MTNPVSDRDREHLSALLDGRLPSKKRTTWNGRSLDPLIFPKNGNNCGT